jgi:hypothetical protein
LSPPRLAPKLQRLPPILHNPYQSSTSSCSKGPRGLSVLMQLTSIFTRTSISPGLWLRQWESRYAIRAGRNFIVIPSFEGDRLCLHLYKTVDNPLWIVSTLTAWIHLRCQSYDFSQSGTGQMFTSHHSLADTGEQLKVLTLSREQRICLKVRNDSSDKDWETSNLPLECLVASVRSNRAATEVFLHSQEHFRTITVLTD